jgi:hypothetical protein
VLGSLSKLLEELPNLETPDVIGDQVSLDGGPTAREGGRSGGASKRELAAPCVMFESCICCCSGE